MKERYRNNLGPKSKKVVMTHKLTITLFYLFKSIRKDARSGLFTFRLTIIEII